MPDILAHNPEVVTIDHMTHVDNLSSILNHGLFSHNHVSEYQDISNQTVNGLRDKQEPIYHRSIHDYVPFYFNVRNAMLYSCELKYGSNIIILGFDPKIAKKKGSLVTSSNAACIGTIFDGGDTLMSNLDWNKVYSESWYSDKSTKQTMMAEILVPEHVKIKFLKSIYCRDKNIAKYVKRHFKLNNVSVVTEPHLFFNKRHTACC